METDREFSHAVSLQPPPKINRWTEQLKTDQTETGEVRFEDWHAPSFAVVLKASIPYCTASEKYLKTQQSLVILGLLEEDKAFFQNLFRLY